MRSKFKWIFTLLLAVSMQFSFAQEKTVTGVVSDASGTLPGANVVVQGTTRGVQTDVDGRYSIKAAAGEVLVFSFVGMADVRTTVGASNVVNATLTEGGLMLSEVIVTGALGIKKTRDAVTSSQQVVDNEELTQAASPNVIQSLAGKVSGLQINTTNSGVTATTRIVLRGNRSLTGNNQALIVIDNAVSSAAVLQTIAPELIESTNVIKGASGAALYGSDGANGVIIVTTKRGAKGGKPVISINSSIDFEEVSFVPQRQKRYGQGWSGTHVAYENGAWGAEMDGVVRPTGLPQADGSYIMAPYSPTANGIKDFFQTGTLTQNGFSINAGDENGYAIFSANRQSTDFVVEGDKLNRNSFLFKGGKKLGKWDVSGIANYNSTVTNTTSATLYTELLQAASNIPIDQFSTPLNQHHWTSYYRSPYWMQDNIRNEARRENFSGTATLNYELNKNINFNYTANIQLVQSSSLGYTNGYTDVLKVGGGDHSTVSAFDQSNSGARNIYGDFLANFNYDLSDKLNLKFNIGNNVQDRFFNTTAVGGTNLTIPGLYTISNVETPNVQTFIGGALDNGIIRSRSYAFFANVDLAYDDYLFLNLTGRNDWTSLLDQSKNNYFYPSVGLSFIPTKAFDALDNNDILRYAKIAGSFVRIGNNNVAAYAINDLFNSGTGYPFGNNNSFVQQTTNTFAFIRPEFYETKDITVNLEFFKNSRLTLDVSAFQTDNTDLNTNVSASSASGLSRSNINIGQTRVKGLEIDLGFTPIDNRDLDLKWTNRLSFYSAKTDVIKVSDEADELSLANFATSGGIGIFAVKGEEFPLIKGIGYQRDDQGRIIVNAATGMPEKTLEYITLGKATPDYVLTYNTAVDFKGFRLAAVMDYRTGHQFWSGNKQWLSWSGHLYDSAVTGRTGFIFPNSSYADPNNPGAFIANETVVTGGTSYATYLSYFQDEFAETAENFVIDATAFKVRELSLSYGFKPDVLERAGLTSLRVGVTARNPFMVLPTENRNYSDPEQSRSSGNDLGIAATNQYPLTRTYGFNVNLTF